jgi:outer membrane protein TolC
VDLQVNYSLNGAGGTEQLRAEGFLGPVTGTRVSSFGSVLGDIFTNDFPTWRVGVTLRYELGNSFAKASLQRARLERSQADGRRRSLEVQIAQEVRRAGRSVITNRQRVEATQTAQDLAERRLQAEQRQLDLGLTPPFFVVQAQRDLALARNSLARAVLFYTQSLVDFEAVQEVSLVGGF